MNPSENPQRRTPLYYCYECHSESQPLMMPDPHCASCHGTFVEEIPDNSENDPRNFTTDGDNDDLFAMGLGDGGNDPVIHLMNALMAISSPLGPGRASSPPGGDGHPDHGGTRSSTIRVDMRNRPGTLSFTLGGGGHRETSSGTETQPDIFPMGRGSRGPGSMPLAGMPIGGLLAALIGGPRAAMGQGSGQLGDYALNQQALDEIITQLMENNQGSRPVAAPDDVIARLPRSTVEPNSPLLQKDCAVCKDSFEITHTPSIITLPCNPNPKYAHSFHEDCILPWLKQNGTCPVCRHELVPQPQHGHAGPPSPRNDRSGGSNEPDGGNRDQPPERRSGGGGGGSGLSGLWDMFTSRTSSSSHSSPPRQASDFFSSRLSSSSQRPQQQQRQNHGPSTQRHHRTLRFHYTAGRPPS